MPIIVTYLTGRQDIVEGESWARLDQDSPRLGTINLKTIQDGTRIIVNKSAVAKVEEIPPSIWDKRMADFQKAQAEELALRAKAAAEAADARRFSSRIKRFLKLK
jgi:hypothetical protein